MSQWTITTYTRNGEALAEYESDVLVSWVLNDIGQLEFRVATNDPKCTEEYLRFGNLVRFSHSTAGSWGGVIWTPRMWSPGYVTIKAMSAEYLFNHRRGAANKLWKGTAGNIFTQIIADANSAEDTRIRPGNIWGGGPQRQETSRDDILWDAIKRVQERSGNDFYLTPQEEAGGRLYFAANWVESAGDVNGFQLVEGVNIRCENQEQLLTEQGDIINDVAFSGIGATVSARPRATFIDPTSSDFYGLRQGAENSDAETVANLLVNARAFVSQNRAPRRTYRISATDETVQGGSTYGNLGLGDVVYLYMATVGFYGSQRGTYTRVRILAKELSTKNQAMQLVVDEVL